MIINQILHGYENGHNKLASSINLSLEDDNLMRVMSDWTGFTGLTEKDDSYITCYTLPDSKLYVIAKTWYAKEMPRPGCVWTHSLIINLEKTDDSLDFRKFGKLFIRPQKGDYQSYFRTISNDNEETKEITELHFDIKQIESLVYDIANNKEIQYRIETTNNFYQSLCLTLIQYLPIEIVKNLTFCTGTDYKRNINNKPFNLAFNKNSKALLSKAFYEGDKGEVIDYGVYYWSNSIVNHNEDDKLVRLFSGDIKDSSEKYWFTGWLLDSLDKVKVNSNKVDYKNILSYISKIYPEKNQGTITKEVFLSTRVANMYVGKVIYCQLLCTTVDSSTIDWKGMELDTYIVSSLRTFNQKIDFIKVLITSDDVNEIGKEVLYREAFLFSEEELIQIAQKYWNVFGVLLNYNHTVLRNDWWTELERDKVSQIIPLLFEYSDIGFASWDKLLDRCIHSSVACKDEYAKKIYVNSTDAATTVLNYIYEVNYKNIIHGFLSSLLEDTNGILEWLKQTPQINSNIIFFIIDNLNPQNSKIVNFGSTAWQSFYDFDKNGHCIISYYIFEFLLSLNWKDNLSLKMLKTSFYNVYNALAHSKLELPQIEQLSSYMAELPIWQSWDNCKKLCRGTVARMMELGYKKSTVKNLTLSDDVNKELMKAWKKVEKKQERK